MSPEIEYPPSGAWDPDPLDVTAEPFPSDFYRGFKVGMRRGREAELGRGSSSKVVLLALGVGAALGFVAGWVAR